MMMMMVMMTMMMMMMMMMMVMMKPIITLPLVTQFPPGGLLELGLLPGRLVPDVEVVEDVRAHCA